MDASMHSLRKGTCGTPGATSESNARASPALYGPYKYSDSRPTEEEKKTTELLKRPDVKYRLV